MINPDIFSYIKEQESNYETDEVQLGDNWWWNMRTHIQLIYHLMHGKFFTGENNWMRAFKQVMKPIVNLANWTEDIEVKDIVFYITGHTGKALSFLLKKYHEEVYTREHNIDDLIDEITEDDNTYGGVLVQKDKDRPRALLLNSIAFCDQTDLLGAPIGFKHNYSPEKLKSMKKYGWGEESNGATITIDELITLADNEKDPVGTKNDKKTATPGKVIEVYVVRGSMPNAWLYDDDDMENETNQLQIVAFYTKKDNLKEGVILYRQEDHSNLKAFSSEPDELRALGGSIGEDMLDPQIWTNFLTIHKTKLLETASKVPLYTDDGSYKNKNKIQDMENLELTTVADGKRIYQVPTAAPGNIQVLQNAVNEWFEEGQLLGSAFDPVLGVEATSGTTFRGQERTVAQGRGSHDRKRGKRAKFIEEIYRDWIIPDMVKEITKGKEFLASLTTDELSWVAETISVRRTNRRIKDMIFEALDKGTAPPTVEEQAILKKEMKDVVLKAGNKQLMEILKEEFKGIEIKMGISVSNKQKNLADLSDKVLSIFQFMFTNPQGFQQAMQIPALAKSFSDILEFSGMSIGDYNSLLSAPAPSELPAPQETQAQPLEINRNEQA